MALSSVRFGLRRTLREGPRPVAALLATGLLLTGCGAATAGGGHGAAGPAASPGARAHDDKANRSAPRSVLGGERRARPEAAPDRTASARTLPGVGPRTTAKIPESTRQAVLVTGAARDTNTATFRLYQRGSGGAWSPASTTWPAHNALHGWTTHHVEGDQRSPVGVFTLTDAGGKLADPGTELPYDRTSAFTALGTGFDGEPLAGAFDYVVAINYNRDPGTSPLDQDKPLGAERGGGIWIHVDHGGPTHGCVSISKDRIRELLRLLDPADHPVVVMGDAASLAR